MSVVSMYIVSNTKCVELTGEENTTSICTVCNTEPNNVFSVVDVAYVIAIHNRWQARKDCVCS